MLDISSYVETLNETQCCVCVCEKSIIIFYFGAGNKEKLRRKKMKIILQLKYEKEIGNIVFCYFFLINITSIKYIALNFFSLFPSFSISH